MARGEKAKSGDHWKIFRLDRRYTWCPAVIGPRTNSLPYDINELEDGVQSTVLKFADHTKLYTEVTKDEGGEQLQEDLDKCT